MNNFFGLAKNSAFKVSGLILAIALIQGCGKSDATKDFKDLKLVPLHPANENQQLLFDKVMNISQVSEDGVAKTPIFLEGEANEVKLSLNVLDPGITAAVMSFDAGTQPDGSSLTKTQDDANTYVFRWTPPVGFIGAGTVQTANVTLIARVVSGPALIANFVARYNLQILVEHTQVRPKIVGIEIPQVINEGIDQIVKIKVQDAAHSSVHQPSLEVVSYKGARNDENHKFNWSNKMTPNQPLVSGPDKDGVYTYSYTMNLKDQVLPKPPSEHNITKPDANASIVNLCFSAIATSQVSNLQSAPENQCTRVQFSAQPPVAYFDGDLDGVIGSNSAIAGQAFEVNFEVKTPNAKGDIQFPQVTFMSFASEQNGKPRIEEIANPKDSKSSIVAGQPATSRFYKMSWTPSCHATGSYMMKLHMVTSLDGQRKSTDLVRKVLIASKSEACVSAAAKTTVAKPAAAAAANKTLTKPAKQ